MDEQQTRTAIPLAPTSDPDRFVRLLAGMVQAGLADDMVRSPKWGHLLAATGFSNADAMNVMLAAEDLVRADAPMATAIGRLPQQGDGRDTGELASQPPTVETHTARRAVSQPDELRNRTAGARHAIRFIRTLSDEVLRSAVDDPNGQASVHIATAAGPGTSPAWVTSRCAIELYERGLITEQILDDLCA